ncbi:MAG: aminomethyl-transferring glycine dehydrogenase subunit GcvPA [Candidatus Eisenbacteria bacterium]|nr:aminomethyl-transferring glycine dehydrogenase subunit GcvPA [Candidatus Eisenbacteria bacterium]
MPYLPHTDADRAEMLREIGVSSFEDLLESIPTDLRMTGELDIPGPFSEEEIGRHLGKLAAGNRGANCLLSFAGGGIYDHHVPAVVRTITSMPQFYTAYTPYQAEVSQGTLQSIYEFQTMIARLTGLDVANASLYDGASATAEAALMGLDVTRGARVLVPATVSPHVKRVLRTYLASSAADLREVPTRDGRIDVAALSGEISENDVVIVQHPNALGLLESVNDVGELAERAGALLVASVDPLSLAVLRPPADYGAAIAVGEGQCLGSAPSYGGPLLGFLAAERRHIRRMPGRIIGATVDHDGRRGYVMTLQTREQHIRRARATSNICTNQGLVALAAAVYMSLLGRNGFRETAVHVMSKAHYAADAITQHTGLSLAFPGPFFREFVVEMPRPASVIRSELSRDGICPGVDCGTYDPALERCLLVSVTERHTREDVDTLASALGAAAAEGGSA